MDESRWFVDWTETSAPVTAYCFPFVAGDVTAFRGWALALADAVSVRAVALPGRGSRYKDPPVTRFDALCDTLCAAVLDRGEPEPLLVGHSMGAVLAVEVGRRMCAAGNPPSALVVSGATGPRHFVSPWDPDLDEAGLVRFLEATGGTPPEVIADPDLLDLVLPVVQADLRLVSDYRYRGPAGLDCPVTAVRAVDDPLAPEAKHRAWAEETRGPTTFVEIAGGHMAAMTDPATTAAIRAAARSAAGR